MDLYQLRYFLEVARQKSFSRAAESLHVSPPAVSKSVALLERSLRRRLLIRNPRHVELTADGERLKTEVQRVYDIIEGLRLEFEGLSAGDPAMLRVGSREMITNYLLTPSFAAFKKRHPRTRFGIYELGPAGMSEALRKDLVDFAFCYESEISDPALEVHKLGALPSHVYASPSLLGGRRPRDFERVCELPFIAPRYFRSNPADPSPDGFPDQRHRRNVQYEGEFLETHRRYVLDGLAAAVLPDFVMRPEWRAGRVVRLPGPPLGRSIYYFKRRSRPLPKAVDEFVGLLRSSISRLVGV